MRRQAVALIICEERKKNINVISDLAQNQRRHRIYNEAVFLYFKETKSSSGLSASNVSTCHTFFQGAAALLGALILRWLGFFFGSNKVAARQGNLSLILWGHYITVSLEEGVEEGRGGGWIRELVHKFDWIKLLPQSGVVFPWRLSTGEPKSAALCLLLSGC